MRWPPDQSGDYGVGFKNTANNPDFAQQRRIKMIFFNAIVGGIIGGIEGMVIGGSIIGPLGALIGGSIGIIAGLCLGAYFGHKVDSRYSENQRTLPPDSGGTSLKTLREYFKVKKKPI